MSEEYKDVIEKMKKSKLISQFLEDDRFKIIVKSQVLFYKIGQFSVQQNPNIPYFL